MYPDLFLILLLALPFGASLVVGALPDGARRHESALAGAAALACLILLLPAYPALAEGRVLRFGVEWVPALDLRFTLRLDGLSWVMALLIAGVGALVSLYARYYMTPSDPLPRFFAFLLAFMGAMMGVVLAGDILVLVFFWELTSLFSFLLIGFWRKKAQAREGARMAFVITSAGGLCLLAGALILRHIVGSGDLDRILAANTVIRAHPLYMPTLCLIALGAFTKSAQFPFHFWLPHAMAAPTPVSAYLHSATMVKAGVYLLIRMWPALGGSNQWLWLISGVGLATFVLGAWFAVFRQDLKSLLAYSTISHLGLITLLTGLDTPMGQIAAIFHLMNHAAFKASLFMAVGIIDHEAGTRDIRQLSGLGRAMPITAALAMVAAAAMAGVPLLNGFLSKEMFFAETIETHDNSFVDRALPYIVTLASMFSVAYSLRFIRDVFFGPPAPSPKEPREPPRMMRRPAEVLVVICLVVGVFPNVTVGPLLDVAARATIGPQLPDYSLALWHGLTPELGMSVVAMIGGVLVYIALRGYLRTEEGAPLLRALSGKRMFDRALVAISWRFARWLETVVATRRLQTQLLLLTLCAVAAASAPVLLRGGVAPGPLRTPFDPSFALIWIAGGACALGAAGFAKFHRFAALAMLGGVGLAVCATFVRLAAPDLALTQLVVETVTTTLLLLGLRWLPRRIEGVEAPYDGRRQRFKRLRDAGIAAFAGTGLAALAFWAMTRPAPDGISSFFVRHAYTGGGGTNIVNVMLVDFRGFDTLVEIGVLGAVALTVFALLRRFRPPDGADTPQRAAASAADDAPDVTRLVATLMFPAIAVIAIYFLLRGHDLPGGGFVAGVLMAIAFILQYVTRGALWVEARLRVLPVRWIGLGLLVAVGTGLGATAFGRPFLTTYFAYVEAPLFGKLPTASALIFDLGVFSLVVGATVLMLIALSHQSVRGARAQKRGAGRAEG